MAEEVCYRKAMQVEEELLPLRQEQQELRELVQLHDECIAKHAEQIASCWRLATAIEAR